MQDIPEIKQHTDSYIHKYRNTHSVAAAITRVEVKFMDDNIFIKNIPISYFQWHSIIDRQCALCKVAVNNLTSHVSTQEHIVRLIQARVNYVDETYYRMVSI